MRSSYLLLLTEISGRGGIEVFSLLFLGTISQLFKDARLRVLLLNNYTPPPADMIDPGNNKLEFFCCGAENKLFKRMKFVILLLWNVIINRPKLIISNHINLLRVLGILSPILRVDYGVVVYGTDAWDLDRISKKIVLTNAKFVASFSRYTTLKINEQISVKGKIFPLPPPISGETFFRMAKDTRLIQKYKLENSKVLLTVARLEATERRKGYDTVIKALPKIIKEIPNVKYLIVGSGSDMPRVKTLVKEVGVEDHVVFCGFVPNEKLIDYYNLCDVFVMPSKQEGFGIVFLEALACGKPVIAGNKDGSVDALLDGELGILVDPDSVDELADSIIKVLLKDVPEKLLDGEHLRRRVLETYGIDKFRDRVKDIVESTAQ